MARVKSFVLNMIGHSTRAKVIFLTSFLFLFIFCIYSVYSVWSLSMENKKEGAMRFAAAAVAGFRGEELGNLAGDESDLGKREYTEVREGLRQIVAANGDIRFAYIFTMHDDKIFFVADSEPEASGDYSPPGQEYFEATFFDKRPFYSGEPEIVHGTDRWGTWVSILMPVKDPASGKVVAVFGFDFTQNAWCRKAVINTSQAIVVSLCLLLAYLSMAYVIRSNVAIRREKVKLSEINEKLRENERSYSVLLSNLPGLAFRCKYDEFWTMLIVSEGCLELTGYSASSLIDNKQIAYNDLISPKYHEYLRQKWDNVIKDRSKLAEEYEIITASGSLKWVLEQGQAVYDEAGNVVALEGLVIDITDRKRREDEIQFLNNHDYLTGIYNRRFFEMIKERLDRKDFLPLSVIIGDINGVKLVNDALGHAEGDKLIKATAEIMQKCSREDDIAARTGGDEFLLLMPFTDKDAANERINQIREECERYNCNLSNEAYAINVSLGFATKESMRVSLNDTIKLAEDFMYKRKLLEHKSSHSVILSSIKATMHEKSHETQEHAERLTYLAKKIGTRMGLTQLELDELELVATLHDIGKVGVDDRILNKPGKLTDEEWIEMKKHSEIGYRIAMSTPDLVAVAEFILYLHERWDGNGYPQGISSDDIPLLSRIVSVVDAYDAMTENRPYRKAMSDWEAASEIRKSSGTQFDPEVVEVFLEKVLTDISGGNE